jgi:hypothetical protein
MNLYFRPVRNRAAGADGLVAALINSIFDAYRRLKLIFKNKCLSRRNTKIRHKIRQLYMFATK